MGFREVSVVEVREVLRAWLEGEGLRTVAERAGVDRKTARRYVAAAQAAEPITLGLSYPRTGSYKEEGLAQMRGALLAIDELNAKGGVLGRPLRLSSLDDASRPEKAARNVDKLAGEGAVMLFGGASSAAAIAAGKRAREHGLLYFGTLTYSNDTTGKDGHRYLFRECNSAWMSARVLGQYLAKQLPDKRYFYVTADYTWGNTTESSLRETTGTQDGARNPGLKVPFPGARMADYQNALTLLAEMKLLEEDTVSELQAAYAFLRDVEHRLQYLDDQQTQTLPTGEESRARIARSMGFADWDSFLVGLNQHRNQVNRHFQQVFLLPTDQHASHPLSALWQEVSHAPEAAEPALAELGYHDPAAVARQLASLARSQRYQQLPATNRKRFDALIPPLVEVSASFANPDETLSRILGLLEAISRRAPYLALLTEYPQTLRRLATLYAASPWVATYLTKHPILLDELLDARVLYAEPDWTVLAAQLEQQLADCGQDVEGKMDVLRHFQHAQQFRLVAQDLAGMWPLEALSDQLSLLADTVLAATLRHAWLDVAKRHIETPRFAIVGYGKLGGKELGYGSDLDLIFLYDDPHPDAPDLYARLVRKLSTWLTSATSAGILYDVDLRLRPNGQSGLLVSSVEAFLSYQRKSAWLWEHQALTRARFVAGDSAVGDAFEKIRFDILSQPRDLAALRTEVLAMRARMRESHPAHPSKPKHAHGGIVDLEFIVQYWVLAYSHLHPELTGNIGNIALLKLAANAGLLDHDHAEACQAAYRYYRRVQHAERLNEHGTGEADAALSAHYAQVSALWTAVLGGEG